MCGLSIELDSAGFDEDAIAMDWIGLHWISLGLDFIEVRLHWIGLGMDWIELNWISFLELWMVLVAQNGLLRKLPEFCLVSCGIQNRILDT